MPLAIGGIEVSLRSGETHEEIPTYKSEQINSGTIAAFIPSEAGEVRDTPVSANLVTDAPSSTFQTFEVSLKNRLVSGEGLVFTTYVDGREMYRFAVNPFQNVCMEGVYDPAGVRPFTFAKLQLKGALN